MLTNKGRYSEYEYEEEEEEDYFSDDPNVDTGGEDDKGGDGDTPPAKNNIPEEIELDDGTKITIDELKKGYMRQSDYTRKTQELANLRKGNQPTGKDEEGGSGKYPKEDVEAAKYFAKIAKDELGLMTKEEFERERAIDQLEENIEKTIATAKKDGISVKRDELITYMQKHNLPPDVAFREMKRDELMAKAIEKANKKKQGYFADTGTGKPKPSKKKYDVSTQEGLEQYALDQLK